MKKIPLTPHSTSSHIFWADIKAETKAAYLITSELGEVWVPKSICKEVEHSSVALEGGNLQHPVMLPEWFRTKNPILYDLY